MPSRTTFEHRGDRTNKYGHRSHRGVKRCVSPFRGKVGNTLGTVGCPHCNPSINNRVAHKRVAVERVKDHVKYDSEDPIVLDWDANDVYWEKLIYDNDTYWQWGWSGGGSYDELVDTIDLHNQYVVGGANDFLLASLAAFQKQQYYSQFLVC